MYLKFLNLTAVERSRFFVEAAGRRAMQAAIMEKDFWVCWLLGVLFQQPDLADHLTFKGGTSLSKVFGVIARFSEDIDLSLAPAFVGIPGEEVEKASSRTQRDRWMVRLEAACATTAKERLPPELETAISNVLGRRSGRRSWVQFEIDDASHSPTLLFHYPTTLDQGTPYIQRVVKLELGSLTDQRPVGRHPIRPWVADEVPAGFGDWSCEVVAVEAERSFWEKATILHAEHHRSVSEPMPPRFSRHYADLAALARHPVTIRALDDADLRCRVVEWKKRFFARSWAHYELAQPGTFRLIPSDARIVILRADYAAMRDMYLEEPPPFDEIIATLVALEGKINGEVQP